MTKEHANAYEAGYQDGIMEGIRRSNAVHEEFESRLKSMIDRYRDLIHDLRAIDGWPDNDKLWDYGINPNDIDVATNDGGLTHD